MSDFLLELLCEEVPARMQLRAAEDLHRLFAAALAEAGTAAQSIETFVTPRRLALIARGLPAQTQARTEERRGPRVDAPTAAIDGFLKSAGLPREALIERDDPKGRFLYALVETSGRATADVLADAVPRIVRDFPWPKSQRWGAGSLRWVRPLTSIVALLDGEVVPLSIGDVPVGRTTHGHRFMSDGPISVDGADDYEAKLRAAYVILRHEARADIIRTRAKELAQAAGFELVEDEALVLENAGLTEWPVPLLGRFDAAFLDVPPEVIQLTAAKNQKYFVCRDPASGKLANAFVCTANIEANDGGAAIVAGNQKVLAARLSDARFFWEQDRKQPLDSHLPKLEHIVFHEKLGTMADRVERIAKLARWLAPVAGADPDAAERAARLCKADLVTGMVGEFPELQGVMGGYYARAQGEDDAVADAIRDHYKPVGQGDDVPAAPVTVAVALAEKLDTLCSFFAIDERPTGSKDPFALRRAALGVIRLLLDNGLKLHLRSSFEAWAELAGRDYLSVASAFDHLGDFFVDRLAVQQREAGIRHDYIRASERWNAARDGRLDRIVARARALQSFLASDDGTNLLAGYKRAANILRIEEKKDGRSYDGHYDLPNVEHPEESALRIAIEDAVPEAEAAIAAEDFEGAMRALATLRAPIDAFFNHVTVNDSDADVRVARLNLLARFRDAVHRVADFSKIEG